MRELFVKALGMGADRGIMIQNTGIETLGSAGIAKILAKVVDSEKPDLVLTGRHGIDDDNMHVQTMIAEHLGWPHINVVTKLTVANGSLTAERSIEGGQVEVYEAKLPCIVGADKALNQPRFVSLPGLMKAKKKTIDVKTVSDYGFSAETLKTEDKVKVRSLRYPAEKPKGKLFKGEAVDVMVDKVVKLLREEARII